MILTYAKWLPVLLLFLCLAPAHGDSRSEALQALRDGKAVLMLRHALAPGTGDPSNFEVGDCSTQRNLNEEGRRQARRWKPFLQEHGIEQARVFTSQWCRSRHTAEEMDMGEVTELPPLNSFFGGRGDRDEQTSQTIEQVNALGDGAPIILVSHQVNVSALAGVYTSSNGGVIIRLPLRRSQGVLAEVAP